MNPDEKSSGAEKLVAALLWVGGVAILLTGVVAIFYFKSFDTQYAPGYSAKGFRSINVGDTEQKVLSTLGPPFSTDDTEPYVEWIYSADKQRKFSTTGEAAGTYTSIRFDTNGRVTTVSGMRQTSVNSFTFGDGQNYLNLTGTQIRELKGSDQDEIKKRFGSPLAIYEYKASKVLRYSRSPSSSNYHLRLIGVDKDGKVVGIWKEIYWD